MVEKDAALEGLYKVFHDGPCGNIYQQWETCVEGVRKFGNVDTLGQTCPMEHPAVSFAACMQKYPAQYSHLVEAGTPQDQVVEGLSNIFGILYGHCRTEGKCKS
mmetsp:Transcript_32170/g.44615  ORF Transcript_32170/g.44615 Transcript_32170/m.44615 type:complete len:104 (+) Transcript_32170:167-478(+)|eukprot:CAMPEP_0196573724 /NCGR_PEP_ID=MMETSP1081-20130531/3582_1 /TAXON_ID=36882 /ORGANISM="Pyramimonas amylifera, Strain CCMP720" /LENGTH=103 /DNA_ID=CAMNT_0041891543 /DNA_START=167 /DNA_END=478 /DNA_ORIENTATION=+